MRTAVHVTEKGGVSMMCSKPFPRGVLVALAVLAALAAPALGQPVAKKRTSW
jgi:hypothetical protein